MRRVTLLFILTLSLILSSCFKDEPLNSECDIEEASITAEDAKPMFFNTSDMIIHVPFTDSTIVFNVRRHADLTALAPEFKVTEGATISPESGSVHDFSAGNVAYRVTSEDGNWHRDYMVGFNRVVQVVNDTVNYDFEHFALESKSGKYYVWNDVLSDGSLSDDWATGNPGFNLSMSSAAPDDYPTVPVADGYDGYAVKLTTRDTGPFGAMVNKRIAAGNLFLGSFDLSSALMDAMKATKFGVPFTKKPVKMTGYYKYKPGDKFQDPKGNAVADRIDSAAIYAVFYRNHDDAGNALVLYGDNVKTSNQIVALADIRQIDATSTWTKFEVTFTFSKDVDESVLESRGYSLAVVFSSSSEGDKFEGAVGSELMIDKVKIICTEEE